MAKIVREIAVDVARKNAVDVAQKNSFRAIIAKQNDSNSQFLKATIRNEGQKIPVEANAFVLLAAERADGEVKTFAGMVNDDGTVTVPITGWMLELDDLVRCEISIIDPEGRKLTSTAFMIEVERAAYAGSDVTEDEHYDPLIILLGEVAAAKEMCDTAAEKARGAASEAQLAAAAANQAVTSANKASANADEAASAAKEAAKNADAKAGLASAAADKAEEAVSAANAAAKTANNAAGSANDAASNAYAAAKEALEAAERADDIVIVGEDGEKHLGKLRIASDHLVLDITQLKGD